MFARSVTHLTDQETYLEDSTGRRWRVKVCIQDGSLAIRQGWPEFLSEHGVDVGDFLVFHYVPATKHFIVQIFGTSGCEKIKFCSDIGEGGKRARTHLEETTPVEQLQTMDPKYKKSTEASQFGGGCASGDETAFKSEPSASENILSLNAVSYICLVEIDGRDFLKLPESWQEHLLKRAENGRMIIFLQGPDKRIWPTVYYSRSGINVLTGGWKQVAAVYGLNPGDKCLFQLVNQRGCIFDVRKI
ncbi:hypothetical protein HAX54_016247 [Datura stramonium]|uniref:TF-B3 domain-containing protein n=1 Tax=Datura stramonium TaxID=4076 RepID=A0ABS8UK36_DATST|nr:hypothetical protein [Datura stramonium]